MDFYEVTENKKQYLDLLLLADEQENMIDRYLDQGKMFILNDNGVKAECVITEESKDVLEIKNIAVNPDSHRCGYGKTLIDYIAKQFAGKYSSLKVGTGDVPSTIGFYEACGFTRSGKIEHFFTDHYDHVIIEDGIQLVDMVYLSRRL